MRPARRVIGLLTACALVATACSEEPQSSEDPQSNEVATDEQRAGDTGETADRASDQGASSSLFGADLEPIAEGTWTFMVYLIGDTDLESFALQDLSEMGQVGSDDELNVVALVDRAERYSDEGVLDQGDWETAKLFHVQEGALDEVIDVGEIDMGDPDTLAEFISASIALFPADNYGLSIWDHGGGWTGMGPDDSSENVLDLPEMAQGLADGLGSAGVETLQLLGFDACLMATYEVASTLAPVTDYFIASQELEPGHGWDYNFLSVLADDPSTDGAGLGREIIETFDAHAEANGTGSDITLSLVDTSFMPALDAAMADFADQLSSQADALGPVVGQQRAETLGFGRSENPEQDSQLADLGMFAAELGVRSLQISDAADAVQRAINDAVIERTAGPARLGSTGLSIYFPPNGDLFDQSYPVDDVETAAMWDAFLTAYHGAGAAIPEEEQAAFEDLDAPLEVFDVEGGVEVEAAFEEASSANLVDAYLTYGVTDPETDEIILLGDDDAFITDEGSVVGFSDLTTFSISDGVDTTLAYLALTTDEESGLSTATVPFDYEWADGSGADEVELSIVLDEEGNVIAETFFIVDESGTWGEFIPEPDGLMVPVLPVILPDGEQEWASFGAPLFTDVANWEYIIEPLEVGTEVYVELVIEDFGGNLSLVAAFFDA